jgi:Immunity protein 53
MSRDALSDLTQWYARHCNGEWEHHHGISIETTDNPGWWVKIDLRGTALAGRAFPSILEGVDARGFPVQPRWLCCRLREEKWQGAGDSSRLAEIIGCFLAWAGG